MSDWTAPSADNRILYINILVAKYGTDDKQHAAAVFLSLALLLFNLILIVTALFGAQVPWIEKVVNWSGSAFLLTAGVAIGQKVNGSK